jgi:hypothetical protein
MTRMMDALVEETGTNDVMFTMVINDQLKQILEGFEEDTLFHERICEEMTVMKGEWRVKKMGQQGGRAE